MEPVDSGELSVVGGEARLLSSAMLSLGGRPAVRKFENRLYGAEYLSFCPFRSRGALGAGAGGSGEPIGLAAIP